MTYYIDIASFSADRLVEIPSRFHRYFPFLNPFTTLSFSKIRCNLMTDTMVNGDGRDGNLSLGLLNNFNVLNLILSP
jgi:hypothetical protein